jgi:hypothetical protein
MAIQRTGGKQAAHFSVGLNIVLTGSKTMTPQEQEAAMEVEAVRVLIVDASDSGKVLVDEVAPAKEFSTGSVGYGLNIRDASFTQG